MTVLVLATVMPSLDRPEGTGKTPSPPNSVLAIFNVNVIPMDRERTLPAQTVLIRGNRILRLQPSSEVALPHDAIRIDATGMYLTPGLADLHVHLQSTPELNLRLLKMFVTSGVTTVLNMRGEPSHLKLRQEVAEGRVLGPRIYSTGPFIGDPHPGTLRTTPAEVANRVHADKAAGYDFIKLHGDLSREAYEQLLSVASTERIRVVGHVARNLGIESALDPRFAAIAHGEEYIYSYYYFGRPDDDSPRSQDTSTAEIARETAAAQVSVMPNLVLYHEILQQSEDVGPLLRRSETAYVPEQILKEWTPENNTYVLRFKGRQAYFRERYRILMELTKALQDSGVRLLVGTDTPAPCVIPGFSVGEELAELVNAGLTPFQALRAATANAGEFLGDDSGKLVVGGRADLVLLRANPLDDIGNVSKVAGVILNGRWLSRGQLDRMIAKDVPSSVQ